MIIYRTSLNDITSGQLQGFFVGWRHPPTPENHLNILKGSYKVVMALDLSSDKVVGFVNAISDGRLSAYIPLLEVLPAYQNQGIGTELMKQILEELENHYMVDLICDSKLAGYYERFSMKSGVGMLIRNYDRQSGN